MTEQALGNPYAFERAPDAGAIVRTHRFTARFGAAFRMKMKATAFPPARPIGG